MSEAIAVSGLRKSYGRTVALDGLDLSVAEGEVHGFLGPNGSGKTTTIRILLGLLRAGGGTARLLGGDPWREATALHRRLAYVPGDVTLWPNFTGGEVIDLLGRLRGGVDAKRRASLLERFDLDPTKKARAYSKGNRQKVALISALASDVELLILGPWPGCVISPRPPSPPTWPAIRPGLSSCRACTTWTCRTSAGPAQAGSARGCVARWTPTSWTGCCRPSPPQACSA